MKTCIEVRLLQHTDLQLQSLHHPVIQSCCRVRRQRMVRVLVAPVFLQRVTGEEAQREVAQGLVLHAGIQNKSGTGFFFLLSLHPVVSPESHPQPGGQSTSGSQTVSLALQRTLPTVLKAAGEDQQRSGQEKIEVSAAEFRQSILVLMSQGQEAVFTVGNKIGRAHV